MQVIPFTKESFRVIQSGPWDPKTFGVVAVQVDRVGDRLEALIDLDTEIPIQFEIDCYEWHGITLFLRTRGVIKWIFQALN